MRIWSTLDIRRANRYSGVPRYWSNRVLRRFSNIVSGDVVNISGWKDEDKMGLYYRDYFPLATSYTVTNFGGDSGYQGQIGEIYLDLTLPLQDELHNRFDTVFCHTVLEHVFDVHGAFAKLAAMTKDLLLVVVPFCQTQHELSSFGDYWRFTPSCLRMLYESNGLTVIFEDSNQHFASGNYIFFAGTLQPGKYTEFLRLHRPLGTQGRWIGRSWWQRIIPYLWIERNFPIQSSKKKRS